MCRAMTCAVCHKTTWAGCGNHIDQVKAQVPAGQWCDGQHPDAAPAAGAPTQKSVFGRIFGR